jgi:hypothetical protein
MAGGGGVVILTACPWGSVATIGSITLKPSSAALLGASRLGRSLFR